jgi:hypothetical protein
MSIEITAVNNFNYPSFVNDIFDKLDEETKNLMVKNVIMAHVEQNKDNEFEISELVQSLTNRVKTLPDIEAIIPMFDILAYIYPFWFTGKL